jgi:hypothetical protein
VRIINKKWYDFPGNPRISFQHQATRLRGERQELRRARAWAVWSLIRAIRPELEADRTQNICEPTVQDIRILLQTHAHSGESELWLRVLKSIPPVAAD